MSDSNSVDTSPPWGLYGSIVVGIGLVVLALFLAGRHHETSETGVKAGPTPEQQGALCQEQLSGILRAIDPKELGVSSNYNDRVHDLNQWLADCGPLLVPEEIARDAAEVTRLLDADAAARTLATNFTASDVATLRTAILLRQIAEHLLAGIEDPKQQAVTLFDYVQRTVLDPETSPPAMTPYEVLLIGLGSPEQRAWVFAELLRQVEMDGLIIEPAGKPGGSDKWLVGVPVGSGDDVQVLLFDMRIGLPIPAAEEAASRSPFVRQPATLDEVRQNDSLLRALDGPGKPYPLTAADLGQVRVGLIGHSSLWSNRVAIIDYAIDVRGARFYDGLGPNRLSHSTLLDRVGASAKERWQPEDVFVWSVPEQQLSAAYGAAIASLSSPEASAVPDFPRLLLKDFEQFQGGPIILDFHDPKTGRLIQWDHPLIKARHLQMTGAIADAIREYNQIRKGVGIYRQEAINGRCLESAVYWTAACQYDLGQDQSVINMREGQYPPYFPVYTNGRPIWPRGMLSLMASSLARLGQFADAAVVLSQVPPDRGLPGRIYLARRWQRLALGNPPSAPPTATPPTATPPASTPEPTAASAPGRQPRAEPSTPPGVPGADRPPAPDLPRRRESDASPGPMSRSQPSRASGGRRLAAGPVSNGG